jgi:hypothetical protein
MDEATRMIIAYAILLVGFPILVAKVIWCIPGAVASMILTHIAGRLDEFTNAAIEGFISFLLAYQLFQHLQLHVAWGIPFVLIVVTLFWSFIRPASCGVFPSVLGIVAGFFLYPKMLMYPPMNLIARM